MAAGFSRGAGLRIGFLVPFCICVILAGAGTGFTLPAAQNQQPGAVQTGPITEPRATERKPGEPPAVKGMDAIAQREAKCSRRLIVNADALFGPGRWTLNPDAGQTLDALASLMAKTGKHPLRIETFAYSAASDRENQFVAERRAITVRGWLVNHGYVPQNTPIEGVAQRKEIVLNRETHGSDTSAPRQDQERVEVAIDTCR